MAEEGTAWFTRMATPFGPLLVAGRTAGLIRISFLDGAHPRPPEPDWVEKEEPLTEAVTQLRAYFAGRLRAFSLPLAPEGTPFRQAVWSALRGIPYGRTISYGELARRVGRPKAARAVGAANGANPLPIVVPCHRVIGADGRLVGYGEGLPIKRGLLALEGALEAELPLDPA